MSMDSHLPASSCRKQKRAHWHSSSSKSMEVCSPGDGPAQQQQTFSGEERQSSGWGVWAKQVRSGRKSAELHGSQSGRESPVATTSTGALLLRSRYAAQATAASASCSSFSRSSFAGTSLRDSQLLMSGEMHIGSVCASFKVSHGMQQVWAFCNALRILERKALARAAVLHVSILHLSL